MSHFLWNVKWLQSLVMVNDVFSRGNLANVLNTIHIGILVKLDIVEHKVIGSNSTLDYIATYNALFKNTIPCFLVPMKMHGIYP